MSLPPVDVVTIVNRADVAGAPHDVWRRVGGFFDIDRYLPVTCAAVAGDGAIGSVRQVGEAILEPMVGQSALSYTYAQIAGPMSAHAYHGCVACEARAEGGTTILYTLVYDQAGIAPDRRTAERERLRARFAGAVAAMARAAEA